jgi:two-component system response regulator YesN
MYEVFFADAEAADRNALRWSVNWEQLGFTCSGEASDGEFALTILRRQRPDLLITDLNLPYFSGLDLCRRVRQELPDTRILICTNSRRSEDIQQAVAIGVDGYLFKDADPGELRDALLRVADRLRTQHAQAQELSQLREKARAYASFQRVTFFDLLVAQNVPLAQLYDQAQTLGIDLRSDEYCFLICIARPNALTMAGREHLHRIQNDLLVFFDKLPQFECFSFHGIMLAVLIKARTGEMDNQRSFCIRNIQRGLLPLGDDFPWVVTYGHTVTRVSALSDSFTGAYEAIACSILMPGKQVLGPEGVQAMRSTDLEGQMHKLGAPYPLSEELDRYLTDGRPEDGKTFAVRVLDSMGPEAIQVPQLCRYIMLRIRLTATAYVHHVLHIETDALLSAVSDLPPIDHIFGREGTLRYLSALLTRTAQLRDAAQWSNYHPAVRAGLHCIDQRFTDSTLTLNEVAEAAGLSPNYFSTLFRKEVGCTFGEYLTQIRMRRARQLLRSTPQRTAQVARAVGYQDTHYFSNLFRKTQGCAPRDFRAQANSATQRRPPAGER